jgi:hypothetical protein
VLFDAARGNSLDPSRNGSAAGPAEAVAAEADPAEAAQAEIPPASESASGEQPLER